MKKAGKPGSRAAVVLNSDIAPLSRLPELRQSQALAAEGQGVGGGGGWGDDAGGTTHLLAFSRVSTFFHSSLFSDVNVSTLRAPSRDGLRGSPQTRCPPPPGPAHQHPSPWAHCPWRPVREDPGGRAGWAVAPRTLLLF